MVSCHDGKSSDEVYTCATRAGVSERGCYSEREYSKRDALLCSDRVTACHGSRKGQLRKIILYWSRGTQKVMRSWDPLPKIDSSAMSHHARDHCSCRGNKDVRRQMSHHM